MIRKLMLLAALGLCPLASTSAESADEAAVASQPNIVWIVADDLGWTDLECYGSGYYQTPNLNRLSDQGLRFTNAYSCGPNCAPTRACLMTGLYSPRHGIFTVGSAARGNAKYRRLEPPQNQTVLASEFRTVASLLAEAGYVTTHFGKWHLGAPGQAGPLEHGFSVNVGGNKSGHPKSYFSPYRNPQLPDGPEGENLTDRLADEVVKFIRQRPDQPFLAYVPFYAVHTPIQAKADVAKKYRERDAVRGHHNPKYAAMIETLDDGVGRILACLDELELADSTIVIFSSDNGGLGGYRDAGIAGGSEITSQAPLRGGKGMLYEGGIRVPLIVRWPNHTPTGATTDEPVTSVDFLPTLVSIASRQEPPHSDGISLVPILEDATHSLPERPLFWHFPAYLEANARQGSWRTTPAGAIRLGPWKLIEFFEDEHVELYHLPTDISEKNDLAEQQPKVREDLLRRLKQWRSDVAAPMPVPRPQVDED